MIKSGLCVDMQKASGNRYCWSISTSITQSFASCKIPDLLQFNLPKADTIGANLVPTAILKNSEKRKAKRRTGVEVGRSLSITEKKVNE